MDKSTEDRFASGFRGKDKTNPEPAADVAIVIAPEGDKDGGAEPPANDLPSTGGPGTGVEGGEGEPPMTHNEKTWQGRLAKREEELRQREAALAAAEAGKKPGTDPGLTPELEAVDPGEAMETPAMEAGETAADEAGEILDDAPTGEMAAEPPAAESPATADVMANAPAEIKAIVQEMSDDFGSDYVDKNIKLLTYLAQVVAGEAASKAIGPLQEQNATLQGTLDSVIENLQTMHRGDIEEDAPDFEDVVNSPEFEQWVQTMAPEAQSRVVQTLQGGSASRIVRVLKQFKDSLAASSEPAPGQVDTSALEAAAGVRSSGASTPNVAGKPSGGSDEEAFKRGFFRGRT